MTGAHSCWKIMTRAAATAFTNGRGAKKSKSRGTVWGRWCGYVQPFKIDQHLQEHNLSWKWMCFFITGFATEVRAGNWGFGKGVKVLIVSKAVLDVNKIISLYLNGVTGSLKLSKTKWIRPLEITFNEFRKHNPPVRKKLPMQLGIHEWLCMKVLEK